MKKAKTYLTWFLGMCTVLSCGMSIYVLIDQSSFSQILLFSSIFLISLILTIVISTKEKDDDKPDKDKGKLICSRGDTVYEQDYAFTFEKAPNIAFKKKGADFNFELLENRPDGFKVNISSSVCEDDKDPVLKWKARGHRKVSKG